MKNLFQTKLRNLKEEGYVVIKPENKHFSKLVEEACAFVYHKVKNNEFSNPGFLNMNNKPRQLVNQHLHKGSIYEKLIKSKEIREFSKALFPNERILIDHSKVSIKFKSDKMDWEPHQDAGYGEREGMTIAIFLEDCDSDNGTIEIYPRSHKLGIIPHKRSEDENQAFIPKEKLEGMNSCPIEAKKGDILAFDLLSVHRSGNTIKDSLRAIFILEIRPYQRFNMSDQTFLPFMIVGKLNFVEYTVSYMKFLLFGMKRYIKHQINI